jgi:hypothetical protein
MQFDVHIYAVVRVKVSGIEAESQQDAIKKAEDATDLHAMFRGDVDAFSSYPVESEYTEDVESFLVDEVGDAEYRNTRSYDKHKQSLNAWASGLGTQPHYPPQSPRKALLPKGLNSGLTSLIGARFSQRCLLGP